MNIDNRLLEFQSNVGSKLSEIEAAKTQLYDDIVMFKSINDSISSNLMSVFKGNGGDSIKPEIEYINQTVDKVKQSIESELSSAISSSNNLNSGIDELKRLLSAYEAAVSKYNSISNDADHINEKNSARSEKNRAYNNFIDKQSQLLNDLANLKSLDSSLTILEQYGKADNSILQSLSSLSGFTASYDNKVSFTGIYYESDGVIYQKIIPICKNGVSYVPDIQYVIVYDKKKLLDADINAGQDAIDFLTGKMNGSRNDQYLWDYCSGNYPNTSQAIAKVMNQILEDTYKANNASTVADYASLSAMIATNSLVHLGYSSNLAENTYGFEQLLGSGGGIDCIGFVRWSYSQGLYETGIVKNGQNPADYYNQGTDLTPLNLLLHHSYDLGEMSIEDKMNIEIGSVLSKPTDNNYHVGIVIGHTTTEDGDPAIIVAQSSNTTIGANNRVYTLESLGAEGNWQGVTTSSLMFDRIINGSTSSTRLSSKQTS